MPSRPMDSSKQSSDSFKHQHETWRRAYAESIPMQERFPRVEQLVVDMAFTDPSASGTYSARMHGFSAGAKAFFAVACPRTLCLHGGFDLDAAVSAMLASGAATSSGMLECHGWLDPTRPDHAPCRLQMHFRLQAQYEIAEGSAPRVPKVSASKG